MITITGLTAKQKELCDSLWACNETNDVFDFIATLKGKDKADAQSLLLIMVSEVMERDKTQEWQEAHPIMQQVISKIKNEIK